MLSKRLVTKTILSVYRYFLLKQGIEPKDSMSKEEVAHHIEFQTHFADRNDQGCSNQAKYLFKFLSVKAS